MLRRFVYLDQISLNQYITAMEGGLTTESTMRSLRGSVSQGGFDAQIVDASHERSREDEEARTFSDTPQAQFDRLLKAASKDSDALAWLDVTQPDVDFDGIGIGAMVSWECELYVPHIIQTMAGSGGVRDAIDKMQNLLPAARRLGLDVEGLPGVEEMQAASSFLGQMDSKLLVVGEDDESDWRVAGQIKDEFLHGDLEGVGRMVGKVSKILSNGHSRPFLTFPGMNLVPREQRRKMERQAPPPGKEEEYLTGPALMLDILAIYR
jgi:hypothetical protein